MPIGLDGYGSGVLLQDDPITPSLNITSSVPVGFWVTVVGWRVLGVILAVYAGAVATQPNDTATSSAASLTRWRLKSGKTCSQTSFGVDGIKRPVFFFGRQVQVQIQEIMDD